MRNVYHPPKCKYTVEDGHIVTDGSIHNKISGTSMAGILGVSPWSTPFQVACALLGVCRPDISDKPAVKVGQDLEPVVIKYLAETYSDKGMFLPAEEIFEKREGDHDSWVSDFEDDVFSGHVDGAVIREDGEFILEIKTSINMDSWTDGVPPYYYWQVALYNEFLTQKDMAYVGLGLVNSNTHRDSTTWIPGARNVMLFEMPIDREEVAEGMDKAREWYSEFILNNRTPEYDPENPGDVEMYNHLCNFKKDIDTIREDLDELASLMSQINAVENSIADLCAKAEDRKAHIKAYMEAHALTSLQSSDEAGTATLGVQRRSSIEKKLLIADGIDPERYTVTKEINTFKFKIKE